MEIEVIKSVDDGYRLWDGDTWLADFGQGPEGEARAMAAFDRIAGLQLANDELRVECERLRARNADLLAALNDYGRHSSRCGFLADGTLECVCGLQAAICGDGRATGEGR